MIVFKDQFGEISFDADVGRQLNVYGYLLSGLVYKNSETAKAKSYLQEGIKFLCDSHESSTRHNQMLKLIFTRNLIEVCLTRNENEEAENLIDSIFQIMPMDEAISNLLALDLGLMFQSNGDYNKARRVFKSVMEESASPTVKAIAKIHCMFMDIDNPGAVSCRL